MNITYEHPEAEHLKMAVWCKMTTAIQDNSRTVLYITSNGLCCLRGDFNSICECNNLLTGNSTSVELERERESDSSELPWCLELHCFKGNNDIGDRIIQHTWREHDNCKMQENASYQVIYLIIRSWCTISLIT